MFYLVICGFWRKLYRRDAQRQAQRFSELFFAMRVSRNFSNGGITSENSINFISVFLCACLCASLWYNHYSLHLSDTIFTVPLSVRTLQACRVCSCLFYS